MSAWDAVALSAMEEVEKGEEYSFPCPCGDEFVLYREDFDLPEVEKGACSVLASCPSCSLLLQVNYDPSEFLELVRVVEKEDERDVGMEELERTIAELHVGEGQLDERESNENKS